MISKADALNKAKEIGMDLVLVAPKPNPPVAKIIDFAKFKFQQEKKEQASKRKASVQDLKDVRLTPFMAENDLNIRLARARKFLESNSKVRFNVWFRGRQITRKQFGYDLLKRVVEKLTDVSTVMLEPKFKGKVLQMTLKPFKQVTRNK